MHGLAKMNLTDMNAIVLNGFRPVAGYKYTFYINMGYRPIKFNHKDIVPGQIFAVPTVSNYLSEYSLRDDRIAIVKQITIGES